MANRGADMREDAVSNYWRGYEDGVRASVDHTVVWTVLRGATGQASVDELIARIAGGNPIAATVARRAILGDET